MLSERLGNGPLPLPMALNCAKDIASAIGLFHQQGRSYGKIHTESIQAGMEGASVPPPISGNTASTSDLQEFGRLFYQMLTGTLPTGIPEVDPAATEDQISLEGIRATALRLACRCCDPAAEDTLEFRRVATELRLLSLMAGQFPNEAIPEENPNMDASPGPESKSELKPEAETEPAVEAVAETGAATAVTAETPLDAMVAEPATSEMKCPRCGTLHVHESRRRGFLEHMLMGKPIYRCHRCCHRYFTLYGIHISRPQV